MSIFRRPLTVRRRSNGSYNDAGFFVVSGPETILTIEASVQPLTGSDIRLLPEGRREEEMSRLYTDTPLLGSIKGSAGNCDIVEIDGADYEVIKTMPWGNNVINHYKVFVSKMTTNDVVPGEASD